MFLEVLLSLVTISIFSIFALRPTIITIAELIKEIDSKNKTVATMEDKIQKLKRAQRLYNQEKDRINLLETSVPKEPIPVAFVRQLEGLSAKHSVTIKSLALNEVTLLTKQKPKSSPDTTLGASTSLSFSIDTEADYSLLFAFVSDLEKMRRPIITSSLRISSQETREGKSIKLVVEGGGPYLKDTTTN